MSQCTCTNDKEATCIVHPTTRSLKDYIAKLEAENKELQHSLDSMVASTWELLEDRNFLKQDCDRLRKELDECNGVIR